MPVKTLSEEVSRLIHDISHRRAEIIDDFTKAYLAHLSGPIDLNRIELVEERGVDKVRWYFRERNTHEN